MKKTKRKKDDVFLSNDTVEVNLWSDKKQGHELTEIRLYSLVELGCENEPVVRIYNWMDREEIDSLEEMGKYIDNLDFGVSLKEF